MDELIGRQAAIDIVLFECGRWTGLAKEISKQIKQLQSAQPKHGKWIHHKDGYSDHYECTACGKDIVLTGRWYFCPNCGARMCEGEQE